MFFHLACILDILAERFYNSSSVRCSLGRQCLAVRADILPTQIPVVAIVWKLNLYSTCKIQSNSHCNGQLPFLHWGEQETATRIFKARHVSSQHHFVVVIQLCRAVDHSWLSALHTCNNCLGHLRRHGTAFILVLLLICSISTFTFLPIFVVCIC